MNHILQLNSSSKKEEKQQPLKKSEKKHEEEEEEEEKSEKVIDEIIRQFEREMRVSAPLQLYPHLAQHYLNLLPILPKPKPT